MKRASITEARNRLSALLERVRHGETVVIEDRGVAVARISAVAADSSADADAVARLERQGIVRPATAPPPSRLALTRPPRPARPGGLSRLVVAERAEGW